MFAESSLMNFTVCPSWALQWLQLCNSLWGLPLLLIDFLSVLLGVPSYSITQLSSVPGEQCKVSCCQEVNSDISGRSKLSYTQLSLCARSTSCCAHCESHKSQKWLKEGTQEAPSGVHHKENIILVFLTWCSFSQQVKGGCRQGCCSMPLVWQVAWHHLHPNCHRFALQNSLPLFHLPGLFMVSASLHCQLFMAGQAKQHLGRCCLKSDGCCRSPVCDPTLTPWETCPWMLLFNSGEGNCNWKYFSLVTCVLTLFCVVSFQSS